MADENGSEVNARRAMVAAGATAVAGLAGGLALGAKKPARLGLAEALAPRRRVLGVPVGRKPGLVKTAEALTELAKELRTANRQVSAATSDVQRIRDQLDKTNRRSPVEVLLDGLTHRRGAHEKEA